MKVDGFKFVFDIKEDDKVEAVFSPIPFKEIELSELYDWTKCDLVERIRLTPDIDIWCDENATFKANNFVIQLNVNGALTPIVGTFVLLGHVYDPKQETEITIPLNNDQVSWVMENVRYGEYAMRISE